MNELEIFFKDFQQLTKKPEQFLSADENLPESIKTNLKDFYDFLKKQEKKLANSKGLPKLHIKNFDTEQIWQEIELQNNSVLTKSVHSIPKLLINKEKLVFSNLESLNEEEESEDDKNEEEKDNHSDISITNELLDKQDCDDTDSHSENELNSSTKENFTSKKESVVDDDFFKLDEMENFLKTEEKKEQHTEKNSKKQEEDSESDEEEDSIDLFEEESDEENDKSRTAKFKDFFRANNPEGEKKTKRNKFFEQMDIEEQNYPDEEIPNHPEQKSTLELRQERLEKKIGELEENAISDKPWTLKGEILAENRPQNSLLEEILEFDMTSRPAPVITETTTMQLDSIIRQRIKDKAFDSVIRKEKPLLTPLEYKKKLTLDQEKSKHSLAQIYEKEYLEEQAALDPTNADKDEEEPELHKEIKTMMRDLFNKLDALSNFHFTPKPAIPEMKIINNLPAITIEEVAPVTSTEASLLAPEEIRNKPKGDILGDSEKTKTDKKRERRKKKLKQKKHHVLISKNMLSNGKKKDDNAVLKHRNTKMMEQKNSKKISSKQFFTQLQEEAKSHINKKIQTTTKEKNKLNARKIKL
ncbi:U3 small nucleolar ribonucleoprotein protein MPP10 [Diorhabda sublineata]|uniref:U3 small nucleolar ribonucleoprotein protein MPP10 n=1 Tax=Diorhabda sublineata TaxID=1163346 RepID=UPI0024E08C21|nr:U3 small nucleolar ribonucleoprotein protein MPP10 [Diorhabda sublineata]